MRYIYKRAVGVIPILIIVVTFVFFFVYLIPGDPAGQMAGPQATRENVELVRKQLGFNKLLPQQCISYVIGSVKGDLGVPLRTKHPVLTEVQSRHMNTVQLILLSLTWSVITGVLIGVWSGRNRSKWQDYIGMTVAVSGISMSSFWTGLIFIMVFAVKRGLLLTTGAGSFKNLIPPSIALGVSIAVIIACFTRSSVVEVLKEDYVRMVRTKGLREKVATREYVFRNRMVSVVTVMGLQFGSLLGGSAVTETVFAFPGLGSLPVGSVNYRDYPAIRLLILIFSLYFILINLAVDALYAVPNLEI